MAESAIALQRAFSDDRFRKVTQRWRSATQVSSLTDSALDELSGTVTTSLRKLQSYSPPVRKPASYTKSSAVEFLARAHALSYSLEVDIMQLTDSVGALRQDIAKQAVK